jgi:hypothetical protein
MYQRSKATKDTNNGMMTVSTTNAKVGHLPKALTNA